MQQRFKNKSILVTGAAGGIGLAAAKAFAAEGGKVLLADINAEKVQQAADAIVAEGGVAKAFTLDVTQPDQCEAMVNDAVAQFGGLHIAFNNAGIPTNPSESFTQAPLDTWDKVMQTNLSGVYYCIRAEANAIKASGGGAIVNTASVASKVAAYNMAAYVSAKHGLAGLTKAAAVDLIGDGIRVNAVAPGFIRTPMTEPVLDSPIMEPLLASTPIGRIGEPEEVANAVLFLASDDASYILGTTLDVDGGVLLL